MNYSRSAVARGTYRRRQHPTTFYHNAIYTLGEPEVFFYLCSFVPLTFSCRPAFSFKTPFSVPTYGRKQAKQALADILDVLKKGGQSRDQHSSTKITPSGSFSPRLG